MEGGDREGGRGSQGQSGMRMRRGNLAPQLMTLLADGVACRFGAWRILSGLGRWLSTIAMAGDVCS